MPVFPKPKFEYTWDVRTEIAALRRWRKERGIPPRTGDRLLVATWNIANLGAQDRTDDDHRLLAEVASWFDLVALQETRHNLAGLRGILAHLPKAWRAAFSDAAGNDERMVFLYRGNKVRLCEQVAEVAVPPAQFRHIKLPGVAATFSGFDRNPFLASFSWGRLPLTFVNVHNFFGDESQPSIERRQLETFALCRHARLEHRDLHAYDRNLVLLGDFNLPHMEPGDPILKVLRNFGMVVAEHASTMGTTLPGEVSGAATPRVAHYDQVAWFPATGALFTGRHGVFDFDGAVFADLWQSAGRKSFNTWVRYHLSDHRPLWAELRGP